MEIRYQLLQKQKQMLSHQQLQSLNILAMDNIELSAFLQSEYLENPMLEQNSTPENPFSKIGAIEPSDEQEKWNHQIEELEDLRSYLKNQLIVKKEEQVNLEVKNYLIECVEDTGYFTMPIEEAARQCNTSEEIVRDCLAELKELEPIGIFSETLEECLLCQTKKLQIEDDILEKTIKYHLEDIAEGNIGRISRLLHISTAQVRKHALLIQTLNPRPAVGFGGRKTEYIVPDIILKKEDNWSIELNDNWIGEYQISDYYLKLMSETKDIELRGYFEEKAKRVKYILNNIEQRRKTIKQLMECIIERQQEYLEGSGQLRPMTMSDVAEKMSVHPSTVSRAIKGKYVQYPSGTILLKELFSKEISVGMEGKAINAQGVKQLIQVWIREENPLKPYSDQKLKEMLEEEGICISRRGVAKYRDEIGIKGSYERKMMKGLL